jgi:tetratricopeptide (TPR) repeat protein
MTTRIISMTVFLAIAIMAVSSSTAQDVDLEPIELIPQALGPHSRPVSTESKEAQAYFDQGMQLKYAFGMDYARRSFREAQKRDPDCAMTYWGEAWAWGPSLNGSWRRASEPKAFAALQQAIARLNKAGPVEKAIINAMQVRYAAQTDSTAHASQDTAYADAMEKVYKLYPKDLDVATLFGEALFLLEPRSGYRDADDPDVKHLHRVLEGVLDRNLLHPGAGHLYIHATESTQKPEKALQVARVLGNTIPGASHINHMPSHTFNNIGLWAEGVRANIQAWHTDQKAARGEAFSIYAGHNLYMLMYAASYDGQGAVAMQAARDFLTFAETHNPDRAHVQSLGMLVMLRFGRFEDVLKVSDRPEAPIPRGFWDFAHGYARLKKGDADLAKVYLNRVLTAADTTSEETMPGREPARLLLGTVGGILEGEISLQNGDRKNAIAAFERAVAKEDSMTYHEPEPLPFSARHWLGVALIEDGQYEQAEGVYRSELEDHPNNGWSYFGLIQVLKGQKKSIDEADKKFKEAWARSEVLLTSSRF